MKGYKKTVSGLLPEDWDIVPVGELCDFIVPGRNKPKIFDGRIPWVTTPDILNKNIVECSLLNLCLSEDEIERVGAKIVPRDSVIMSCVGELGVTVVSGKDIVINQQLHAFIPHDKLYNWYLFYSLQNQKKYINKVATKTAVPYLNKDNCNSIPIPLPSLPEQKKIAEILITWDKAIQQLTEIIDKKRELKKGLMQHLLSGEKRLPGFDGNWRKYKLSDICIFHKGIGLSKGHITDKGNNKCILYGELYTMYNEVINTVYSKTNVQNGFMSQVGDVLVPSSTTTNAMDLANATVVNEDDVLLGGDIIVLRKKDTIYHPEFLAYILTHIYKVELAKMSQGITIIHLYSSSMRALKITLPEYEEQVEIMKIIITCEKEIEQLQDVLHNMKKQKSGLMQQLLTGKKRVKV